MANHLGTLDFSRLLAAILLATISFFHTAFTASVSNAAQHYRFDVFNQVIAKSPPALNDQGQLAVFSQVGSTYGAYRLETNNPDPVFMAPINEWATRGISGGLGGVRINNRGNVAFFDSSGPPDYEDYGYFISDGTSVTTIWNKGQVPSASSSGWFSFNDNDEIAFSWLPIGVSGSDTAVVIGNGGPLRVLAGGQGHVGGVTSVGMNAIALNDNGVVAFSGCSLAAGCGSSGAGNGLFLSDGVGVLPVHVGLLEPPEYPGDYRSLLHPLMALAVNNSGQVIFIGITSRPHLNGIYLKAPDEPLMRLIGPWPIAVGINDSGEFLFQASGGAVSGVEFVNGGLYSGSDPVNDRIAIPSDFGANVRIEFAGAFNNRGQIAFNLCYLGSAVCTPVLATPISPGDANEDGVVDRTDAAILAMNYGLDGAATWNHGDFDGDSIVSLVDLAVLQANLTPATAASSAPVPEPSTVGLWTFASAMLFVRRVRRRQ
jgi:hypothetical protein